MTTTGNETGPCCEPLTAEQIEQRRRDAEAALARNAARRRCGCTGCLSGTECIDPYRAGGI